MGLHLGIYTALNAAPLYTPARVEGLRFSTNKHGFASLSCFLPLALNDSFWMYDRPGLPHVQVNEGGAVAWEGRLEDVAIVSGGVRLTALGYWRALSDAPYTALWSDTRLDVWRIANPVDTGMSTSIPERFEMDNNNRLTIAPQKNAVYTGSGVQGRWRYDPPDQITLTEPILACSFDYDLTTSADFRAELYRYNAGVYQSTPWTLTGNGASQTGSQALTFAATDTLVFSLYAIVNPTTYAGESGVSYLRITNPRVKSTTSASVYADEIADALAAFVNGVNSSQLASTTALIESPALDLHDEVYEEQYPSDIIDRLAILGDGTNVWEAGVWENRALHFRERGSKGRAWYVDVGDIDVERTLEALRNSVYATYQDATGRTLRTAGSSDSYSVTRYGLMRRAALGVSTTSSTQATAHRDAFLTDHKAPIPRAAITIRALYDASGARWPNWSARSGDTIAIRNLPPTSTVLDRIKTFRVSETEYDVPTNTINATPESPIPSLDVLVARGKVGRRVSGDVILE